ncbi:MAG: hypothetical protein UT34_C0001G0254 [candidate division WS6 bacterium GW2011_GWF2_39_15]|uniref:Uncharacterized protein n=1 Tax=candidate division WS6 bacterium GW2011_GWF2_39_15 TaxID=1619100 RepID=A0A0G0MQA6_9BACT|nr:MAG: hypothetical protein UT34_C0001G0254 [candidate division WS6 bacterium GW2011_GWF2_39_15]
MNNQNLTKYLFIVVSLVVFGMISIEPIQAATYCGATVKTSLPCYPVNQGTSSAYCGTGSGGVDQFVNCACTTSIGSLVCKKSGGGSYECPEYKCKEKCVHGCGTPPAQGPTNSSGNVYAHSCPRGTEHWVECWDECNWEPRTCYYNIQCTLDTVSVRCSEFGEPDPEPTCTAQTPCSPTCPAGKVPYNTGGDTSTTSCSYNTGAVNGNGSCTQATRTQTCWDNTNPPIVTLTPEVNASALGCTASSGYLGKDASNIGNVSVAFNYDTATNPTVALQTWFSKSGSTPPTISNVYDTGTGRLQSNDSYGLLVRKVGNEWRDIYVPGINSGSPAWIKVGTVGNGLRAEIIGSGGDKLAGLSNVGVTVNGTTLTLAFKIEYYNSLSGLTDYEQVVDGVYKVYAASNTQNSFLPGGGNTISSNPEWVDSTKSWTVDMTDPTNEDFSYTVDASDRLNLLWRFADGLTSIARVVGNAALNKVGTVNGPISDITSGTNNYILGSGDTGANIYNGTNNLWKVSNLATRTDVIDLLANEGGSIDFTAYAFDGACNYVSSVVNIPLGDAWMVTKGGILYSSGGTAFNLRTLTGHVAFSNDAYWNSPFGFYKDEADISTEVLSSSSGTLNELLYDIKLSSSRLLNKSNANNVSGYWYTKLSNRIEKRTTDDPTLMTVISLAGNQTLSGQSTDIGTCTAAKPCVVKVAGNLTLSSGFSCDAKTVFLVEGTTTIHPDLTASSMSNGCLVISQNNVNITEGSYKSGSSTYPKYDIVEGFLLSDGQVILEDGDDSQNIKDGLKINGSILAFDDQQSPSIVLFRTLRRLDNTGYPVTAIHYDARYLSLATLFFGGDTDGFKQEVGFKPL